MFEFLCNILLCVYVFGNNNIVTDAGNIIANQINEQIQVAKHLYFDLTGEDVIDKKVYASVFKSEITYAYIEKKYDLKNTAGFHITNSMTFYTHTDRIGWQHTVRHETTHVILTHQYQGIANYPWLNEGLSELIAYYYIAPSQTYFCEYRHSIESIIDYKTQPYPYQDFTALVEYLIVSNQLPSVLEELRTSEKVNIDSLKTQEASFNEFTENKCK